MSKIRLSGSNSGYVEIAAAADAGNLTFTMPTTGTALFGNGNNVISGITTFSAALDINSTVDVSGTSVFNNDVTFDGATAGYDVVWDRSDNALEFAANAKATFGNNQDMQLYHDGNNSLIQDSGTGHVQVRSGTFTVGNAGLTKTSAIFNSGSGQQLNFNNSPKFITTNTGVVITGICTATSFSGDGSALTGVSSPLSNRNMVINGAAMISQRLGSGTYNLTGATDYFVADRFRCWAVGGGSLTIQQSSDAPAGFQNSLMFTVNTADTDALSVGNTYYIMQQRIEGYNTRRLNMGQSNAQSSTLSFYVKSDVQGTYCVMLNNRAQNRCYTKEFTVSSADTWEYKTLTYPGDTTGTWLHNNLDGVQLNWCFASGSNYQGTKDQWNTSWKDHTSSQVNFMATSGNKIRFTGIQLEKGTTATEFEHRDFADELIRCKRFFARHGWDTQQGVAKTRVIPGINEHPANYGLYVNFNFDVEMRAQPTVSFGSNINVGRPQVGVTQKINSTTTSLNSPSGIGFMKWPSSGSTGGQLGSYGDAYYYVRMGNDFNSYIDCSAEL